VIERDIVCEVVTPLFSRGASSPISKAYPFELRPQSVKGVMRFWLRAIAPLVIDIYELDGLDKLNRDERKKWEGERYKGLKYLEELIFGSQNRRAPFGLQVIVPRNIRTLNGYKLKKDRNPNSKNPKDYRFEAEVPFQSYSVYGLHNDDDMVTYQYIGSGEKFTLKFYIRDEQIADVLLNILWMVSIFSGFGAKTRKGYGEFRIINQGNIIGNRDAFSDAQAQVTKILNTFVKMHNATNSYPKFVIRPTQFKSLPEFPTFSSICLQKLNRLKGSNWSNVMEKLYFSSRNSRGMYLNLKGNLRRLKGDSVASLINGLNGNRKDVTIYPAILGLPIQYQNLKGFSRDLKVVISSLIEVDGEEIESRKASPAFISIHGSNNNWFPVVLLLESWTTGDREHLRISKSVGSGVNTNFNVLGFEDYKELQRLIEELGVDKNG